jgi:hypothetical protein
MEPNPSPQAGRVRGGVNADATSPLTPLRKGVEVSRLKAALVATITYH